MSGMQPIPKLEDAARDLRERNAATTSGTIHVFNCARVQIERDDEGEGYYIRAGKIMLYVGGVEDDMGNVSKPPELDKT